MMERRKNVIHGIDCRVQARRTGVVTWHDIVLLRRVLSGYSEWDTFPIS